MKDGMHGEMKYKNLNKLVIMARNWNKFRLDELTHFWKMHKQKQIDPLMIRQTIHSKIEITDDEKEELIDHLLQKLWGIKEKVDEAY